MIRALTDIVLVLTGFQLLLVSAVLLGRRTRQPLRRSLLAGFLLSKAFLLLRWAAYHFRLLDYPSTWGFYYASAAGFFLLAPALYLYVRSLCAPDFRWRAAMVRHALPGAGVLGLTLLLVAAHHRATPPAWAAAVAAHYWDGFWALNLGQILTYLLVMVRTVAAYRRDLRATHSAVEDLDLTWVRAPLLLAALHWLFVTTRAGAALLNLAPGPFLQAMDLFSITIFLAFTTALVVCGLGRLEWVPAAGQPKYAASRLDRETLGAFSARLERHMTTARPHLRPSLTIDELAAELGLPAHQLSQVINTVWGKNFFGFINGHRVDEAKRQLENAAVNQKTMLQILYESGFNSKSSFNEAFKRHAGMTPSTYRRRLQAQSAPLAADDRALAPR